MNSNKRSTKQAQRQRGGGSSLQTRDLNPREVKGPNFPPEVGETIMTTVRYKFSFAQRSGGYKPQFSPAEMITQLPGNKGIGSTPSSVYWRWIRLVKVSVWNTGKGTGEAPRASISFRGSPFNFTRLGVEGSRAASLHVAPPLQVRQTWYYATDETVLADISFDDDTEIQLTVEVISDTTKVVS